MYPIINTESIVIPPFLFIHIRKAAGTSAKNLLMPHYVRLNITKKNPPNFLQIDTTMWNALLNTPKCNLGPYIFKRSLFAKEYLYKESWNNIYSFSFSRDPIDRVISMYYYLFVKLNNQPLTVLREFIKNKKFLFSTTSKFDLFLDWVELIHVEKKPHNINNIFTTHTAPMAGDVSDEDNNLLLSKIFRVESFNKAIYEVYETNNLSTDLLHFNERKNVKNYRGSFYPNESQLRRIQKIYHLDFEIYENAK